MTRTRRGPHASCALALTLMLAAVLAGGCADDDADRDRSTDLPPASATGVSSTAEPGAAKVVHVNGHDIYAECRPGSGPTVVFLHGAGGQGSDWNQTIDALSGISPCTYDRFNVDSSGRDQLRHSPAEAAADLEGVLEATGMEPPYVLVAHSWGGLLALIEAGRHPEDVAGLVMVDATLPFETELDPPDLADDVRAEMNAFERGLDAYDGYEASRAVEEQLPDVPMTFVFGTEQELPWPTHDYEIALTGWVAAWRQGRLVRCTCGHDIPTEAPELIGEEVHAVVAAAS